MRAEYDFADSRGNPYLKQLQRHDRRARIIALVIIALLIACSVGVAVACPPHRSMAARAAFERTHPCPANGATRGACPGYVIDHKKPLCAGGADAPANMQWQTVADAAGKDRIEWAECRRRKAPA